MAQGRAGEDRSAGAGGSASWWRWAADGREPLRVAGRPGAAPGVLMAHGRVLEAVAEGDVLRGTAAALARRLGVDSAELAAALREAEGAGWLAIQRGPGRRLAVRWADDLR